MCGGRVYMIKCVDHYLVKGEDGCDFTHHFLSPVCLFINGG